MYISPGNWEAMQTIDPRWGNIIFRDGDYVGIFYTEEFGFEHFFPGIFHKEILESGKPVTGLIFLETPRKISNGKIRLRISTPAGEYIEPAVYNSTNHLQTMTTDWSLPMTIFFKMPEDISKLPIKPYHEVQRLYGSPGF
jgi:hypothetical protein